VLCFFTWKKTNIKEIMLANKPVKIMEFSPIFSAEASGFNKNKKRTDNIIATINKPTQILNFINPDFSLYVFRMFLHAKTNSTIPIIPPILLPAIDIIRINII
jgi:hypothetical protein